MRRAPIVLTGTALSVAGVLSFHARTPERATALQAPGSRSVLGDAVDTQYGAAQVRVTIQSGRITDVEAVQLQGNDPKSVEISGAAEPILRQEALQRQSAAIDTVSGATFTSASYAASLQSALDRAGFRAP